MKFPLKLKDRGNNICRLTHSLSTYLEDTDHRPDFPLNPRRQAIDRGYCGENIRTGISQFSVAKTLLRTRARGKDFSEAEYLNGFKGKK